MNETLNTIAKRFSCRSYTDEMPTEEQLMSIIQAGIEAPSGMNRQGWQVILVKDKELIADMDAEGMEMMSQMEDQAMYNRIMARGGKLLYNAPCLVVIAIKEADPKGAELVDLGIVAQNIVLAATSLGVDNVHCGLLGLSFAGDKSDEFKSRLQFPEGYEYGIGVLLGFAKETKEPHEPDTSKITVIG